MNLGKQLANVFKDIGQSFNISPATYKERYSYKPKSDREAMREDWEGVGDIFKDIMGTK